MIENASTQSNKADVAMMIFDTNKDRSISRGEVATMLQVVFGIEAGEGEINVMF